MSPIPFEAPTLEQLSELLPAYEFDQLIAQGGMGAVYKARQRSLDRDVAIKILPRELGSDPLFRESFESEAKAMAKLSHTNLIKVYDYGDADGLLYTVMEYVHGKSLFSSANSKKIDPSQAIEIVLAASNGLSHAHENGIVHRDIKPGNILLNEKCEPKIGDFGLARPTGHQSGGLVMGTPGYSAPEVLSHPEEGDQRSDIFALGVVLKELLTGVPANSDEFQQTRFEDAHLERICAKATAADPAMRHPDVSHLCESLKSWRKPRTVARPQVARTQNNAPVHRPSLASSQPNRVNWPLMKNCAVIAFLLCAISLTWNLYTKKQEIIAEQARVIEESPANSAGKPQPAENHSGEEALAASTSRTRY
ncbi:serine/threonine-protein kinase [Haloferula sp.]|uniref:serine/threonine-protein kinase n=1 Tax=Haloferula sp. TaxID=2497595 RepID=UPI00329CD3C7